MKEVKGGLSYPPAQTIRSIMSSTQRRRFRQAPNFDERLIAGTAFEFEVLGSALTRGTTVSNDDNDKRLNDRRFRASFGCSSKQCAIAWILVCDGWHDQPIAFFVGALVVRGLLNPI